MHLAPRAILLVVLLSACAQLPRPAAGPDASPDASPVESSGRPLILGAAPFMPGGVEGESLAEAAAAPLPSPEGYAMEAGADAETYARICAERPAGAPPVVALATRHPTPDETASCATKGIALTSVQIASYAGGATGPDAPQGAFLVYDARDVRPEARALVERIDKNRVALFGLPGYAELFVAHG